MTPGPIDHTPKPGRTLKKTPTSPPSSLPHDHETIGERTLIGTEHDHDATNQAVAKEAPIKAEFKASLKVINNGTVSNYSLKKEKTVTSLGSKRDEADIVVNDPALAAKQLVIIYHKNSYILVDCGADDLATFDGILARQVICPIGARCIVTMHNTTVIFDSAPATPPAPHTSRPRKRFHMDPVHESAELRSAGTFTLQMGSRTSRSNGEPILIGRHQDCDITVTGNGVKPFHAMVHWGPEGIYVTSLPNATTVVSGEKVDGILGLQDGDTIDISGTELTFNLDGDIMPRCRAMFGDYQLDFNYIRLTSLPGSVGQSFMLPAIGGAVMIGRSPNVDVTLRDGSVSREHVQLIPNGKSCQLIDNYSANGCYVNSEQITKARLRAGDLIEIGRSIFFLHFD